MRVQLVCPNCGNQFDNPEGKSPTVTCPKCKKPMTRPMGTATGTPERRWRGRPPTASTSANTSATRSGR